MNIADHKDEEVREIHRGGRFIVLRARRNGRAIVIKTVRPERRIEGAMALRRELDLLRDLGLPGIARPIALEEQAGRLALVLQDAGPMHLGQRIAGKPMPLGSFFEIATQLARIVAGLHGRKVVHRDVNPTNVVLDEAGRVTLVDFDLASRANGPRRPDKIEGTLAYMSPEQTGRMNRAIDRRSDLYSLGATFYEMLTGSVPFPLRDPMEVVHAHLARLPVPPHVVEPAIPEPLSDLVLKLLAKAPEHRYQTAEALEDDLAEAQRQLRDTGRIVPFVLGRLDLARQLVFPERLYGREAELEALEAAFDRSRSGPPELVLVSGPAGVGKTALVEALRARVTRREEGLRGEGQPGGREHGGLWVVGKADQHGGHMPYAPFVAGFREALASIAMEPAERLAPLGQALRDALGDNAGFLVDPLPELRRLIGEVPAVGEIGAIEAQSRFLFAFRRLVGTLASLRPLAIVIDDLQWSDAGSLKLLASLAEDLADPGVLLVAAFRPDVVREDHPLASALEEIRARGGRVTPIELRHLDEDALVSFLVDALGCDRDRARPLAAIVHEKTRGNPFFVRQLLRHLQSEGLLAYDLDRGTFRWDTRRIDQVAVTENVVDLTIAALHRLPDETQQLLATAACIGNRFEVDLVAKARGSRPEEISEHLAPAIGEGLIVPERDRIRFAHDRVQRAAYDLWPEGRRRAMHFALGKLLAAHRELRLFEAVDQLDLGAPAARDPAERRWLAEMDRRAGRKAMASAAYGPALAYLRHGHDVLPDGWQSDRELTFDLLRDAAECAYLTGDHRLSAALVAEAKPHAATALERARLCGVRLVSATLVGEYEEAIREGREGLSALGMELPEDPGTVLASERAALEALLAGRPPERLLDLPAMKDAADLACMELLGHFFAPAWFTSRDLHALLVLRALRLTLERGLALHSARTFADYGIYLVTVAVDYERALAFGRSGVELSRRFRNRAEECKTTHLLAAHMAPWRESFRTAAHMLERAHALGVESGELQFAAYAITVRALYLLAAGETLERVSAACEELVSFSRRTGEASAAIGRTCLQACRSLQGRTSARGSFDDRGFVEGEFLSAPSSPPVVRCVHQIVRHEVACIFGDLPLARERMEAAEHLIDALGGLAILPDHAFYGSLTLASLATSASPHDRRELLARIADRRGRLAAWAESCPANFRHALALVDAEVARLEGRDWDAAALYDQAVEAAEQQGFQQVQALANERAARHFLALGRRRIAEGYLGSARQAYEGWGATAKVRALEEALPPGVRLSPGRSTDEALATLDLHSILRAAETIASEVVLDRLLGNLVTVCLQAAGADRAVLVLEEQGGPVVRATSSTTTPLSLEHAPLASFAGVPRVVVEQVRESREAVVSDVAGNDPRFASDPYVAEHAPKSILAVPIHRQAGLLAVLCLENHLTTHAFTRGRVKLLEILSAPIAISLENGLLFERLNAEIEERKRAEGAVRFLADASVVLAESLDVATTLARLARHTVPFLADWCVIDVIEEPGKYRRVAGAHFDPEKAALLEELSRRHGPDKESPQLSARVLSTGEPQLRPDFTGDVLRAHARDEEHLRMLSALGTGSALAVPLTARGRTLGAITLISGTRGRFGQADLALAQELARRAALAIDNARLFQESQRAIRLRDEFLSIASHELYTPITSMHLAVQSLSRRRTPASLEDYASVVGTFDRQIGRLTSLVRDLLDVSHIEAGRLPLRLEPVDLGQLVHEVAERLEVQLASAGSQLTIRAPAEVVGRWDRSRVDQVVTNLLGNALKFGAGQPIEVVVEARASTARLAVRDHGIGIPPERRPGLFERFERAVSIEHYGGLGLGLYIVRGIVKALGGTVAVDSVPGEGSTFTVEIPIAGPKAGSP